jgi:hypothetical protein
VEDIMTRTLLLALAGLSLLAAQPATADTAQRNPMPLEPVILRMSEILKVEMGNKLAEEAAVAVEAETGATKPAQK